jgi:hypothetical protein
MEEPPTTGVAYPPPLLGTSCVNCGRPIGWFPEMGWMHIDGPTLACPKGP